MRVSRPRFPVRPTMIGVAVVAMALAAIVIPLHRLRGADDHLARARVLEDEATRGELMCMTPRHPEDAYVREIVQLYGPEAGRAQGRAFEHRRLARAYRRVAWRFWLPAPDEPPDPHQEDRKTKESQ